MQGALIFSRECKAKMLKEGWEEVENIRSMLIKYDSPEGEEARREAKAGCLNLLEVRECLGLFVFTTPRARNVF